MTKENVEKAKADAKKGMADIGNMADAKADVENKMAHAKADAENAKADIGNRMADALK